MSEIALCDTRDEAEVVGDGSCSASTHRCEAGLEAMKADDPWPARFFCEG